MAGTGNLLKAGLAISHMSYAVEKLAFFPVKMKGLLNSDICWQVYISICNVVFLADLQNSGAKAIIPGSTQGSLRLPVRLI